MTNLPRLLAPLTAFCSLLLLAGCNLPKDLAGIDIAVQEITAVESSGGGLAITCLMYYRNETVVPVGITGTDLTLSINGIRVERVQSERAIGTPSGGVNTQSSVFTTTDPAIAAQLLAAFRRGTVSYQITSKLEVMSGDTKLIAEPSNTGTLDVSGLQLPGN